MPTIHTGEPQQLSLFLRTDGNTHEPERGNPVIAPILLNEPAAERSPLQQVAAPSRKPKVVKKQEPTQEAAFLELYGKLKEAEAQRDGKAVLSLIGISHFNLSRQHSLWIGGNRTAYVCWRFLTKEQILFSQCDIQIREDEHNVTFSEIVTHHQYHRTHELETVYAAYVSPETATTSMIPIKLAFNEPYGQNDSFATATMETLEIGKPIVPSKLLKNVIYVQPITEIMSILREKKPYIIDWLNADAQLDVKVYLKAPWLETLYKAGYTALVSQFLYVGMMLRTDKSVEAFNRLCGPGTRPKDIFKCSKSVYTVLKDEADITIWDTLRKLEKKEQVTGDAVTIIYNMNLDCKSLNHVNTILGQKRNGRPIFTITSLVNYLNRLDMYEALVPSFALSILSDYLLMCSQLNMPPRVDGDSLRREHDIAARLCRERRNRIREEQMREWAEKERRAIEEGNTKLSRASYREDIFFVRPITEYNDLLNEAIQQDNCVAAYADRIASGKSRIFTMRETAHPERSLVTIELSPDCRTIRQKYLARNQVIRNKAINDFIERWHKQLNAA